MAPKVASTYRPNSTDATLARIMVNQENFLQVQAAQERATAAHRAEIKAELNVHHRDLNQKLDDIRQAQDKFQDDIKKRVTELEKDSWIRSGKAAAAVFFIGFASWFIPWFFTPPKN